MGKYLFKTILWLIIPIAVIASIWAPLIFHNYVHESYSISEADVSSAIELPNIDEFNELNSYDFFIFGERAISTIRKNNLTVEVADKLLQGLVSLPDQPEINIDVNFNESYLELGTFHQQLRLASFIYQYILLLAYEETKDEKYFNAVEQYIHDISAYERKVYVPLGFLWNDHALAGKVIILAKFWSIYRSHSSFNKQQAQEVLQYILQAAARLADEKQFTYATNHGVMQNLALLHLGVAFPTITKIQAYAKRAAERLEKQYAFYINDEGVTLEHSSEYHEMGVELVGLAIRYYELLDYPLPGDWLQKYQKTQHVFTAMRRTDASLPSWGDTAILPDDQDPAILEFGENNKSVGFNIDYQIKTPAENNFYPAAGISIWWDGTKHWPIENKLSQTLFTWSDYEGLGHKHADELSFTLWAQGERWWMNAGYWPYDDTSGRNQMTSWAGSNAPHLLDEEYSSERASILHHHAWDPQLAFIDVERLAKNNFSTRRQLLHIKPDIWLTIDSYQDKRNRQARTVWTTEIGKQVELQTLDNTYQVSNPKSKQSMTVQFVDSDPNAKHELLIGNKDPLLGWVQLEGDVHPTHAFVTQRSSKSQWSATLSIINGTKSPFLSGQAEMQEWLSPDTWALTIPTQAGGVSVSREGNSISVQQSKRKAELTLQNPPDVLPTVSKVKQGLSNLANEYTYSFRDLRYYRQRMTKWLIGALIAQEVFFLLLGLFCKACPGYVMTGLRIVNIAAWSALGWWLFNVYFS